ncbi:berberine bridge enzyme-like 17 [Gastrolobium bilobum]|uniref:berberine bridge enzyme-like 17 n=1 Tax=Gastrolobium bilobum TaxID=150636 RepID=UPI002AB0A7AA|nr:berberine bridge enzyme-like 17 [Gastrolobium bilobum]
METFRAMSLLLTTLTIVLSVLQAYSQSPLENFLSCLPNHSQSSNPISKAIYTPDNPSFSSILNMHIQNKRFKTATRPKPLAIITAMDESHVQATVICAKPHGIQIRIRSGGHDYEGFSFISDVPFVVLDMFNLNSVDVNIENGTTLVQAGATLGQVYYQIAQKSQVHAFPAGVCITLGAGGHFSGGGYGNLMRKYGLSVDNIIDATLVDANGKILDRKSMGEYLFWAIRGGGGASFGVILSWKIKLVSVPPQVTVFTVKKTVEEGATDVVYKWQQIGTKLHEDLFVRVQPQVVTKGDKKTVEVSFIGQFLGQIDRLLPLVNESFPELGLKQSDCIQMPWVNSTLYWVGLPNGTPIETLITKPKDPGSSNSKSKSDYVKKPIPKDALESIWKLMIKDDNMLMQWNPYGGKMAEISPSATPFPHRAGNLFLIQYMVFWTEDADADHKMEFLRSFYEFMTPYVSDSPREAFLNYRDIDIGGNHPSNSTRMDIARIYGSKFFKDNFDRLVSVKSRVDPDNFFRYEQSIPVRSTY